jgi:hypothetical protein
LEEINYSSSEFWVTMPMSNLGKFAEWISESGYQYDGYKFWVRKYQTPISHWRTFEEDWLNTEQLVNKFLNESKG